MPCHLAPCTPWVEEEAGEPPPEQARGLAQGPVQRQLAEEPALARLKAQPLEERELLEQETRRWALPWVSYYNHQMPKHLER